MILEHYRYDSFDELDNIEGVLKQPYIFLKANNKDELRNIVAQAISLDIRGNYGDILGSLNDNINESQVKWSGNLFKIIIDKFENTVKIIDLINENEEYMISFSEWNEALVDWKEYYLNELGFLSYSHKALSHVLGVALLTFDQINDSIISTCSIYQKQGTEIVREAIKKSGKRYGIKHQVIYRDCKKVTGVPFFVFSSWLLELLLYNSSNEVLFEHIMYNVKKYINYKEDDIGIFFKKYFLIELDDIWLWK